jgi:integrase
MYVSRHDYTISEGRLIPAFGDRRIEDIAAHDLERWRAASRPRRRGCARAGLRKLRFHDLRHTFGTQMIAKADIVRVQEWMGHADIETTRRYLHYRPRPDDVDLLYEAFALRPCQRRGTVGGRPLPRGPRPRLR